MSNVIEDRIVSMKFDNANFEKNVKQSIDSLHDLKKSLDSTDSVKGLTKLQNAAKNIDLSGLNSAVEGISSRFTTLGIVGVTALQNIINKAVDTGIQVVKSLSVDQIMGGFQEYELKMDSIQTIMAGTGESLERVKGKLEELNTYADKTIYSFSDMTNNISKFTNAGVDLDSSVAAIQGVANVAALAGSNSQQASHAMLNFSQALSTGYIALIDWKSIKNAQMDTLDFKQSLVDAAVAMGTLKKKGDEYTSTTTDNTGKVVSNLNVQQLFNEGLKAQWLTTEVLTETLQQYSTDVRDMSEAEKAAYESKLKTLGYTEAQIKQIEKLGSDATDAATKVKTFTQLMDTLKEAVGSGWAMTFEYILGDFEQAKDLWTAVNNEIGGIIEKQAESRNHLLKSWNELGGRANVLKGLSNIWTELKPIAESIQETFREIFPKTSVFQILSISSHFVGLTRKFKVGEDTLNKIKSTFKGLFAALDIGKEALKAVGELVKPLFGYFKMGSSSVLDFTASIGENISALRDSIKENDTFHNKVVKIQDAFKSMSTTVHNIVENIKAFKESVKLKLDSNPFKSIGKVADELGDSFGHVSDAASSFGDSIRNVLGTIDHSKALNTFSEILAGVWALLSSIGGFVANVAIGAFKVLAAVIRSINFENMFSSISIMSLTSMIVGLKHWISNLLDPIGDFGDSIQNIREDLALLKGAVMAFTKNIESKTLLNIAFAVAILAGSLALLASIQPDKLASGLGAITGLLAEVSAIMAGLGFMSKKTGLKGAFGAAGIVAMGNALKAMAVSVLVLAAALKIIASIDANRLVESENVITALLAELTVVIFAVSKMDTRKMGFGATGLMGMSVALLIIAEAAKSIADIPSDKIQSATIAVAALIGAMALFVKLTSSSKKTMFDGDSMFTDEKSAGKMISVGLGMIALAGALKILADVANEFAKMDWEQLGKAGAAIGTLMALLTAFTAVNKDTKGMISTGLGIIAIGYSMKLFAENAKEFASMNWVELGKAGAAIFAICTALALLGRSTQSQSAGFFSGNSGLFGSSSQQSMLAVGAALIAFAYSLKIFAGAAERFGMLKWTELAKGGAVVATLCLSLGLLSAKTDAKDLAATSASLLIFAGAVLMLTPALELLGHLALTQVIMALGSIVAVIAILGISAKKMEPIIPAMLQFSGAMALFGVAMAAVGAGLIILSAGVTAAFAALPAIVVFLKELLLAIVDVFVEGIPTITNGILMLITGVVTGLSEYLPQIVESTFDILIQVMHLLREKLPELVVELVALFGDLFKAVGVELKSMSLENLIPVGAIMTTVLLALAFSATLVKKAMVGVVGIIAVLTAITIAFLLLSKLDPNGMLTMAEGLGIVLVALSASLFIISKIPVAAALQGIASLGIALGGLVAILAILGGLNQIPGFSWLLGEGAKVMESIGAAIGGFIGGIVQGVAVTVASGLPKIGLYLSAFMVSLKPFLNGIQSVDSSTYESIKALASAMLVLTGAELVQGIASWLTGGSSLIDFGKQLAEFGPFLKRYYSSIEGIDAASLKASSDAALSLAEMAKNLPNRGGLAGWFAGENDMDEFGAQLVIFGTSLKMYADAIDGINPNVVKQSSEAALSIAELANNLPNMGGVSGWFMGENDIDEFGLKLKTFGRSLKEYSEEVEGVKADVVVKSSQAGKAMAELASTLPNTGGVVSWFTGNNDMDEFGRQLSAFGTYLSEYSQSVSEVDPKVVEASASACGALRELATSLPNSGGMVSWFTGDNTLDKFGQQLVAFGTYMVDYYENVETIDTAKLSATSEQFNKLAELCNNISKIDPSLIANIGTSFTKAGKDGVAGFIKAFDGATSKLSTTMTNMITKSLRILSDKKSDFEDAGKDIVLAIKDGISRQETKPFEALVKVVDYTVSKINKKIDTDFLKVGKHIVETICNGVVDSSNLVSDSVESIVQLIQNGVNDELEKRPIITPVLDISGATASANKLNNALNASTSMSLASTPTVASTNRDVVKELNSLRSDFKDLHDALSDKSFGNTNIINGITYDDGSSVSNAIETLTRALQMERRM